MFLFKFFLGYVRRYAAWLVLAAIAVPVYAVASTAMVALIEPIFGEVLQAGPESRGMLPALGAPEAEAAEGGTGGVARVFNVRRWMTAGYEALKVAFSVDERTVVYFVPILFVAVLIVRAIAAFVSGYAFQHVGLGVTTDVRNDLYGRVLDQSSRFHSRYKSGELVSRVVNDVSLMQTAVSNQMLDLIQQSLTLVLLLGLLLSTDLKLALICLIITPAVVYPVVRFGAGMRKMSHRSQERLADVTDLMTEGVRGQRVIKAFGMEEFENEKFRNATRAHLRANLWAQVLANLSSPVIETIANLGAAAFLIYAGLAIREGTLTAPLLVQFLANLLLMYDPIRRLNRVNLALQHALAAAHRVAGLMHAENEVVDRPGARELPTIERGITFESVTFGYEGETVLDGIDLEIRRGEIVALVGPSGAGKTTLANLLPRFFDPDAGAIRLDGTDLRDIRLKSLRGLIGLVSQETVLFDDTVHNNIAYGRTDLSRADVERAAHAAYADEFVRRLPRGYDTHLGESGSRLSGGQRQRVAIARALIKNAPILILDEATSQLDGRSEALVQKALQNLLVGRTTLVIAHRLATVMRANRIVVLEAGRVAEQGTHDELMRRAGAYKRLYDLQFDV